MARGEEQEAGHIKRHWYVALFKKNWKGFMSFDSPYVILTTLPEIVSEVCQNVQ